MTKRSWKATFPYIEELLTRGYSWPEIAKKVDIPHIHSLRASFEITHGNETAERAEARKVRTACDRHLIDLMDHHKPGTGEYTIGEDSRAVASLPRGEYNFSLTGSHF